MALLSQRPWRDWLAGYEAGHRHPANHRLHLLGVPLVAASLPVGALALVSGTTDYPLPAALANNWPGLAGAAAAMFAAGWTLQLIGHRREGAGPSFLADPRFLIIGLVWWVTSLARLKPWRGTSSTQAPPAVAARVFDAQIALLYRLAAPSLLFSMVAAPLVCWLLVDAVPHALLAGWLLLSLLLNLGRLAIVRSYARATPAADSELWARRFWIGTLLNGCIWGLCGSLLMPRGHPDLQFALVAILGVIPGIAFSSQAAIRAMFMAFVLPFITPVALSLLFARGVSETVIGVAAVVFLVVLWVVGQRGERDVIDACVQRFENDDLMIAIREAHARAELASRELAAEVAERERAQAQLVLAKDAAESANLAKSMFLANMSHEIRTPMNGIIGMTELLQRTTLLPKQQRYVDTVQRSGHALLAIINDILDVSKIEAGKVTLEEIAFDLLRTVRDVYDLFSETAAAKGIALHCTIDPDLPQTLFGDPMRLRQVLVNLVGNAVKFTSAGEVVMQLRRLAFEAADQCRLAVSVSDTGIGMDEAARRGLFRSFSQGDSSTTRKFGGTGLGLAISRHLVVLMGGTIDVASTPGRGTRFSFAIDLRVDAIDSRPRRGAERPVAAIRRGSVVLLVEDNAINRLVAQAMLEEAGCIVSFAETGAEALALLANESFDLVLMDVQMPVMDGMEATRRIRVAERQGATRHRNARVPIVALTANAIQGDRERCLTAGMDDYLTKPFTRDALHELLARWLPEPSPADVDRALMSSASIAAAR